RRLHQGRGGDEVPEGDGVRPRSRHAASRHCRARVGITHMRISPEVEIALSVATNEAARRRHEYVTIEHLLYALLFDDGTADIVRHAGGDVKALKKKLETFLDEM